MKTITKQNTHPKQSKHALIQDAFVVLREHLGPEKTLPLWHLCMPPQEDYGKTRRKLFAGRDVAALAPEAQKFNRE